MQLTESGLEDERNEFIEEMNLDMLEEQHNEDLHCTPKEVEQVITVLQTSSFEILEVYF